MEHRRGHYIPQNAAQFDQFIKNIIQTVDKKTTGTPKQWDHIPPARIAALGEKYAKFSAAFSKALADPTHANILARQEAQAEVTHELREFNNQFLFFPPVTNPERAEMGLPNRDLVRTPHVEVEETVEFSVKLRDIREVLVDFWVKGADNKAKPEGYDGAAIIWAVLDAPPSDPGDLTQRTTASKTPYAIEFAEAQRGKTVYIAAAWQNGRSHVGRWSEIQSAVIP